MTLRRITRDRPLSPDEAATYREVRSQVAEELPQLIERHHEHLPTLDERELKIIVEQHPDGFVAYPVGLRGVVIGQGDTRQEAVADVESAIRFHSETFGDGKD